MYFYTIETFGIFLANLVLPHVFTILGIVDTMCLMCFLNGFSLIALNLFTNIFNLLINGIITGVIYQSFVLGGGLFWGEKYKDGLKYMSTAANSRVFIIFLMQIPIFFYVNPDNIPATEINSIGENFFNKEISDRYVIVFEVFSFLGLIAGLIFKSLVKNPKNYENQFMTWYKGEVLNFDFSKT